MRMTFKDFIADKPLYYDEIDHTRVHLAYGILFPHIMHPPKTIHIVGTNGKGSTGRILAHLAYKSGANVGHFSSPHILKFNERIWLNGEDISDEVLETAHHRLWTLLGELLCHRLSYFEYTTLLALLIFEECDVLVLEAGLGGEFDATNVCDKALSIITPIGIDHQAFLGETIPEIATTKINSIQKQMLLAPQRYPEVEAIAYEICMHKKATFFKAPTALKSGLEAIGKAKGWAGYLSENANVALEALEILEIEYKIEDLADLELWGRFYPLTPNIRIDVGHNPLASLEIVKALEEKVVLIYNSLDDKDYKLVLETLKPKVKRVEIIAIDSQRALTTIKIEEALESLGLAYSHFDGTIDEDEKYLVFGSFYVVETFLKITKGIK